MSHFKTLFAGSVLAAFMIAATKLKMEDLPEAVQQTVVEQTKAATLVGISKETEKGKTMYEVETKLNGKTRDLMPDANGAIDTVEEEVDLASIPPARKPLLKSKPQVGLSLKWRHERFDGEL